MSVCHAPLPQLGTFLFSIVLHKIATKIEKETPLKLNGLDEGV